MTAFSSWIRGMYDAIAQAAGHFLMLEIIPGLHMYTLVITGVFAILVSFFLSGGEST